MHWHRALTAAITTVSGVPSISSAAKFTAYESDMVDALRGSGSVTLSTELADERTRSDANSSGWSLDTGRTVATMAAPAAMTAQTNRRAAIGSVRMATGPRLRPCRRADARTPSRV